MTPLPPAAERVRAAALALGLDIEVREMPTSTRTAAEAAAACGADVGQIVKSLIFRGATSGAPYLLLVSGANRVDEAAAAARLGEALERPDAAFVRTVTGFAIGGVPPFGHASTIRTYMDADLLTHAEVWAAAGTPKTMFRICPQQLCGAAAAEVIALA